MSATLAGFDVASVRALFPGLDQNVHGKPLAYLDSAATSQIVQPAIDAWVGFQTHDRANVHRAVHTLSQRATESYEAARRKVADWIGAESDAECVFLRGTTEAINLVAHAWARPRLHPGDRVVVTEMEHHSNLVPWQLACEATGAELVAVPVRDDGSLDIEAYEALLDDRVAVVAVAHISNVLGTVNPVRRIADAAHAYGAVVVVDGAQAIPHQRVDVAALDADFYAFSGHKMFGPTGIGVLWGRKECLEETGPYQGGGSMIETVTLARSTWAGVPQRFEAGTPDIAGAIALGATVDFLAELDWEAVAAHEQALLAYAVERLREVPGIRLIGEAAGKASVISFVHADAHATDIGTLLDLEGVAIRTGHHCAEPLMKRFGVEATARASLALYTDRSDVDALAVGLRRALEVLT